MPNGIVLGQDESFAEMLFRVYKTPAFKYDRCLGVVTPKREVKGIILFHNWNGNNVELSYYGQNTLSLGIIRCIARFLIVTFDPSRVTVVVSKRNRQLLRSLQRFGFKLEGMQRCHYGKQDTVRNTGVRLVLFRDSVDRLAKLNGVEHADASPAGV